MGSQMVWNGLSPNLRVSCRHFQATSLPCWIKEVRRFLAPLCTCTRLAERSLKLYSLQQSTRCMKSVMMSLAWVSAVCRTIVLQRIWTAARAFWHPRCWRHRWKHLPLRLLLVLWLTMWMRRATFCRHRPCQSTRRRHRDRFLLHILHINIFFSVCSHEFLCSSCAHCPAFSQETWKKRERERERVRKR